MHLILPTVILWGMVVLVLAGGKGKRYGGGKQWAAVDAEGQCLAQYTLYDACLAGADRVVWVVNPGDKEYVENHLAPCIRRRMPCTVVEQTSPTDYGFEPDHPPLGTGHALLCGLQDIKESFVLVNADDYYGRESIALAVRSAMQGEYACVAYPVGDTVGDRPVHRALCHRLADVTALCECSVWRGEQGELYAKDASGTRLVPPDALASMNLWALQPAIITSAVRCFAHFLREGVGQECGLNDVVNDYFGRTRLPLRLLTASNRWYGVTYREDAPVLRAHLASLRAKGLYPRRLWN